MMRERITGKTGEEGVAMILAVLLLTVLTMAAVAAITSTGLEIKMASNDQLSKETFYAADAGMDYARQILTVDLVASGFSDTTKSGYNGWTQTLQKYAHDASTTGATDTTYEGGVWRVQNVQLGGTSASDPNAKFFDVRVWNNMESTPSPTSDTDQMVWVRVNARSPQGVLASVEALLTVPPPQSLPRDYIAQMGGGSAKNWAAKEKRNVQGF